MSWLSRHTWITLWGCSNISITLHRSPGRGQSDNDITSYQKVGGMFSNIKLRREQTPSSARPLGAVSLHKSSSLLFFAFLLIFIILTRNKYLWLYAHFPHFHVWMDYRRIQSNGHFWKILLVFFIYSVFLLKPLCVFIIVPSSRVKLNKCMLLSEWSAL